jgi:hypothetical protein
MPNIVIPNTSEGRAILSMMTQQSPTVSILVESATQTGFKRKYPFSEMAVPVVPAKKTRYN